MALNALEQNTISRAKHMARKLLEEVKPIIDGLNIAYDGSGGVKSTVDQADLDSDPSLSNPTKAQLDDALYVMTDTIRTALANSYTQLAQLAVRA